MPFATSISFSSSEPWQGLEMRWLISFPLNQAQMFLMWITQSYISVYVRQYECTGLHLCPWINACFHVYLLACTIQYVHYTGYETVLYIGSYFRSDLPKAMPSNPCLCAAACVIQYERRKPRDTSVAFSRLWSSALSTWFFDGANLEALWLKERGCIRRKGEMSLHTHAHRIFTCMLSYKHSHPVKTLKDSPYRMAKCVIVTIFSSLLWWMGTWKTAFTKMQTHLHAYSQTTRKGNTDNSPVSAKQEMLMVRTEWNISHELNTHLPQSYFSLSVITGHKGLVMGNINYL